MPIGIDRQSKQTTHPEEENSYNALPASQRLTTWVVITVGDGTTREQVVTHRRGTGDHQLIKIQIVDKYRRLTHRVIGRRRQDTIQSTVLGLETVDDIAILTGMLNPPVNTALG